jgi:hypothetical protein
MRLIDTLRLDATVSRFLPIFDGTRTLAEIAGILSQQLQVDLDTAQQSCLQLAPRLLQSNFVLIEKSSGTKP